MPALTNQQQRLVEEAARILQDEAAPDYQLAKRKAARRLGLSETRNLPSNADIEAALQRRQQLFDGDNQQQQLRKKRQACIAAMEFFSAYSPRLAGSVLAGSATQNSVVELHLFADTSEQVQMQLFDADIPFEPSQRELRFDKKSRQTKTVPSFLIDADGVGFELLVFKPQQLRQAPICPIRQLPMERAGLAEVQALVALS